jgi:hypothetical protein
VTKLRVVLLNDHLQEPVLQPATLVGRYVVDLRYVVAHGEEALPSRHGVRSHHWMGRCQGRANVVRRAAWRGVQFEALFARNRRETGLGKCRREGFEESAVGWGDFVVDFARRRPDCVFSRISTELGGCRRRRFDLPPPDLGSFVSFRIE